MDSGSPQGPEEPPPPPSIPPPPGVPTAGMAMPPSPAPPRSRRGLWIGIGAAAVVVAGVVAFTMFKSPSVSLPDQIDGVPRITTQAMEGAANGMIKDTGLNGHKTVAGIYGAGGKPEFLMLATEDTQPADQDKAIIQAMAEGTGGSSAFSIDAGSIATEERAGVIYDCAPLSGTGISGAACVWNDGKTVGVVMSFTDRGSPTEFASHVYDAVVS